MLQISKKIKARIIKTLFLYLGLSVVCITYYCINQYAGFGIPCLFKLLFNIKCPACGITTMFFNIFQGKYIDAFNANPLTFCLLPLLLFIVIYNTWMYIKNGHLCMQNKFTIIYWVLMLLYIVYGILRNIL